jgi:transcriptional regulator with XRE-family HTH domain
METLRIKELLKLRGMTLNQLAERMNLHRVNLSSSINGNPTLERLKEIAKILEVNVSDLFSKPDLIEVNGYLEFEEEIYKITKLSDLESIVEKIKNRN